MKAKFYSKRKVSRYEDRLARNGYRVKYDFDADLVFYYSVQVCIIEWGILLVNFQHHERLAMPCWVVICK